MEEVRGEDESTVSTIEIFLCYAQKDKKYLQRLEQHLSIFQREKLIHLWHDGRISPGEEREQIIRTHLNTSHIVLVLVSPDFIASNYHYTVEMQQALERHERGETYVIPILVRPVAWQNGPLGKLQALPKNAQPIALWRHRDKAFLEVAEGIRHVIEEVKIHPPTSPLLDQQPEKGEKNPQKANVLEQTSLSEAIVDTHEVHQESATSTSSEGLSQTLIPRPSTAVENDLPPLGEHIPPLQSKNLRKRRLLVSTIIFLVLAASLIPFLPLPTCSFAFCHSSPHPTKQPSPQHEGEVHDQNLSVELVAVVSPSFVLADKPKQYSGGITPPASISAVLLAQNTSTYDTIVINVQNLRYGGTDILIDYIALKLLSIPVLPRPLRVWTPGAPKTYVGYPYPVTYRGQQPGQLLYAEPSQNVILAPSGPNYVGESDPLALQVRSTVTAFLRFRVEITYQITGEPQTLTLPQIFQVVFSDASNWHGYILQNGSLVGEP